MLWLDTEATATTACYARKSSGTENPTMPHLPVCPLNVLLPQQRILRGQMRNGLDGAASRAWTRPWCRPPWQPKPLAPATVAASVAAKTPSAREAQTPPSNSIPDALGALRARPLRRPRRSGAPPPMSRKRRFSTRGPAEATASRRGPAHLRCFRLNGPAAWPCAYRATSPLRPSALNVQRLRTCGGGARRHGRNESWG